MAPDEHPTILVVDDEDDILATLGALFEASFPKARIVTARSPLQALQDLEGQRADLVLSDFKMPGMDGLQFLGKVRVMLPGVPRVLMTAFPETELAIRALNEESIQYFFTKPLDPVETVDITRALLGEALARRQREVALRRSLDQMRKRARGFGSRSG